ncbi:hypothetical protein AOQ84DRAFT_306820, partial [Glonium stellatum]
TLDQALQFIYNPTKFSITQSSYTDNGIEYKLPSNPRFQKSLGKEICILDVDTRPFTNQNQIMCDGPFLWSSLERYSAGIMNHFTYAKIHGYDYKFVQAANFTDRSPTWIKPSAIADVLKDYKFAIFPDADAAVNHMQIPMEWLLNYWDIDEKTSLAMALDPDGPGRVNNDTNGRVYANTGFIIARQSARTQDILRAWNECPSDTRYPGCSTWKKPRFHEQSAFGSYVRYDYEENIKELPCTEANGEPDFKTCPGVFISHFWWRTDNVKRYYENHVLQSLTEQVQNAFVSRKEEIVKVQPKNEIG